MPYSLYLHEIHPIYRTSTRTASTASPQTKPATLETGLVIQVPPFVNEGDKVRVNTETGEYQSRV